MVEPAISTINNDPGDAPLSHNLLGQRLGRKGRDTRERILAATERLLELSSDTPISLSAVAREASLGMTTLYLYFSDLTELLLAVLEPIMASAENAYVAHLRSRWPDECLNEHCLIFVEAYYAFWERHTRILHLRNSFADDAKDERMLNHRIDSSRPLIDLLVHQMDSGAAASESPVHAMATVLLTGIERIVTVATDENLPSFQVKPSARARNLLRAEARLLELGIRDCRASARG